MPRITAAILFLLLLMVPAEVRAQAADNDAEGRRLLAAGRYEAALPYFQRDLELAEKRYGPDDPTIAIEVNNLAEVNRLAGRLEQAEKLYRRAIALDERAKPKNPVGLATSLNNLALVYRAQGLLDKAAALHARSLSMLEDALGPNHPDVARSLNNLATLYRLQGQLDRARPLQERAVAIADSTLGPRNPDTQQMRRNLAALDKGQPSPAAAAVPASKPTADVAAQAAPSPTPPSSPEPAAEAATPAPAGGYAVQLAAVPEKADIADEWKRFSRRYPQLKGLRLLPAQSVAVAGKGTFYRVLAGPLASQAEAAALCTKLRAAGANCRVARP